MSRLSIFNRTKNDDYKLFYLQTGTSLDIATGMFQEGISNYDYFKNNNQWYLNGGVSPTFSIVGKTQTYKSAILISYLSRILKLYKDATCVVYDTEFAIAGKERIISLSNELDNYSEENPKSKLGDIILEDNNSMNMDDFFEFIISIAEERYKHKKDYIIESPFINPITNKPYLTIIPFIILIDSFSMMSNSKESELYKNHKLSDSETNMVYMNDNKDKSKFMRQIPILSKKGGIHVMISAHLGKKFNLNPFGDKSKDFQYMKASSTIKNVGSQFGFLTNTLIETISPKTLLDTNKHCYYISEYGNSPDTELNQVKLSVCRCKNNISGTIFSNIVSQYFGILNGVTNFQEIKQYKEGITGKNKIVLELYDKISVSRNSLRSELKDNYEYYRALEIISQMLYIKYTWLMSNKTLLHLKDLDMSEITNRLKNNKKILISDILNSRGTWTYDKKDPRKYLSIFDILQLLNKN